MGRIGSSIGSDDSNYITKDGVQIFNRVGSVSNIDMTPMTPPHYTQHQTPVSTTQLVGIPNMTPLPSLGTPHQSPQHSPANSMNVALPQMTAHISAHSAAPSYGKQLSVEPPQLAQFQNSASRYSHMRHASDYGVMDSNATPMGPLGDEEEAPMNVMQTPMGAPGLPQLPSEEAGNVDGNLLDETDEEDDEEMNALDDIYNKPKNSKTAGGGNQNDVNDEEEELMDEGDSDTDDGVDDGLYGKANVETKF